MDMNTPLQHLELTCLIQSLLYGMWTKMAAWKNSILTLVFIRITLPPWFSVMSMLVQPLAMALMAIMDILAIMALMAMASGCTNMAMLGMTRCQME